MKTKPTRWATMFLAVCTAIAASVAGLNSVWQAAIFVAIAGALAATGLELHRHKNLRGVKVLAWIAAATIFWFASVDRLAAIEFCQRCPIHQFQNGYRFLGFSARPQYLWVVLGVVSSARARQKGLTKSVRK